jgi:hypothetical protein
LGGFFTTINPLTSPIPTQPATQYRERYI